MKNKAESIGKEAADRVAELERVLEFRADVIAVQAEEIEKLERELAEEKAVDKFYHNIISELKIMVEKERQINYSLGYLKGMKNAAR